MTALFQIGFLAILVIVVAAEFEYDLNVVQTTTYSLVNKRAPKLDYNLMNADVNVYLERVDSASGEGRSFVVLPIRVLHEPELWEPKDPCKGFPGIRVSLQKKENIFVSLLNVIQVNKMNLCYTRMNIEIRPNPNGKSLRLSAKFYDSESKTTVEIFVDTFKEPMDQANKEYVNSNDVPRLLPPIPSNAFIELIKEENYEGPGHVVLKFVGGISWLKNILDRAVFLGAEIDKQTGGYTEFYYAPPAILETEIFDKMVDLGNYVPEGFTEMIGLIS